MARWREAFPTLRAGTWVSILGMVMANSLFAVLAQIGFKLSAESRTWRAFLAWQVVGNLSGFLGVLALTWLLRYLPLHVVFPVTTGLAVIGVQVLAARWLFRETIEVRQWAGTLLIVLGIFFIAQRTE